MFLITVFFFLPGRWFTKNSKVIVSIYLLKEIKFILCQLVIYFNSMKNCKTNKEYKIRTVFPNSFIAEKSHKDLLSECFSLLLPLKELLNHYPRHSYCGQVFRTCQPFLFFKLKQVNKRERWKTQRRRDTHTHTHTHTHGCLCDHPAGSFGVLWPSLSCSGPGTDEHTAWWPVNTQMQLSSIVKENNTGALAYAQQEIKSPQRHMVSKQRWLASYINY